MSSVPQIGRNRKVELKVEDLTPSTFNQWTDGSKWLCVAEPFDVTRPPGVGRLRTDIEGIKDFILTYPHPVGTFFVVCEFDQFVDIAVANPNRDLRYLIV